HGRGKETVGHELAELQPGGGPCEGSDAQRVEETHDGAEEQGFEIGNRFLSKRGPHQNEGEEKDRKGERNENRNQHGRSVSCLVGNGLTRPRSRSSPRGAAFAPRKQAPRRSRKESRQTRGPSEPCS